MAEIRWLPVGRVERKDGSGFKWIGQTPNRNSQSYWRTFRGERYAQVNLTPGEMPQPDNAADLLDEMQRAFPLAEGPDVPYDADI